LRLSAVNKVVINECVGSYPATSIRELL